MIEIKEAVQTAMKQLSAFYKEKGIRNVLLEEVEFSKSTYWLITIGFDIEKVPLPGSISSLFQRTLAYTAPDSVRKYKIFKINKTTGNIISMNIRNVE